MGIFVRSVAAANAFPAAVQTVSECVYGRRSNVRLKQLGMEFAVWMFKYAAEHQLKAMAPGMLQVGASLRAQAAWCWWLSWGISHYLLQAAQGRGSEHAHEDMGVLASP
eukprot:349693-Chlamydomonas_euryale.AAC.1